MSRDGRSGRFFARCFGVRSILGNRTVNPSNLEGRRPRLVPCRRRRMGQGGTSEQVPSRTNGPGIARQPSPKDGTRFVPSRVGIGKGVPRDA